MLLSVSCPRRSPRRETCATNTGCAFGYALTELSTLCAAVGETQLQRMRRVSRMLPEHLPDDLLEVAMTVCGECDMAGHFATGLDLILASPGERGGGAGHQPAPPRAL